MLRQPCPTSPPCSLGTRTRRGERPPGRQGAKKKRRAGVVSAWMRSAQACTGGGRRLSLALGPALSLSPATWRLPAIIRAPRARMQQRRPRVGPTGARPARTGEPICWIRARLCETRARMQRTRVRMCEMGACSQWMRVRVSSMHARIQWIRVRMGSMHARIQQIRVRMRPTRGRFAHGAGPGQPSVPNEKFVAHCDDLGARTGSDEKAHRLTQ